MRDLDYFMGLPYRMEIEPIPEKDGGGYCASIPQLGRYAFRADGETPDEAIRNLEEVKRDLFATYLEEGIEIPEPESDEETYSGKFIVRIPKVLHRELSLRAKRNGVSLNQFVAFLLAKGSEPEKLDAALSRIEKDVEFVKGHVSEISYRLRYTLTQQITYMTVEGDETSEAKAA